MRSKHAVEQYNLYKKNILRKRVFLKSHTIVIVIINSIIIIIICRTSSSTIKKTSAVKLNRFQ